MLDKVLTGLAVGAACATGLVAFIAVIYVTFKIFQWANSGKNSDKKEEK